MRLLLLAALVGLLTAGCGSSSLIQVKGQLLRTGKAFTVPETHDLEVTFHVIESRNGTAAKDEPFPANVEDDGRFEVPGADGRGIPPGKHRISVIEKPRSGSRSGSVKRGQKAPDRDEDFLKGQFGPTTSPIVRDLPVSSDLTIDLDKPTS
jgi:hypothetical protein